MNADTVVGYIGGTGRNQLASQTLAATTETEIQVNTDNGAGAIAVLQIPQQTDIAGSGNPLYIEDNASLLSMGGRLGMRYQYAGRPGFNSASFDVGRPFLLRLAGLVTPASNAANTLTIKLYSGTSKAGTNIVTTGALTGTESSTAAGSFLLESQLVWDSTSGLLNGQFWYIVNAGATVSYHVWAVNSNPATVAAVASLKFCASITWGNAVGGVVAASEFSISQL